MSQLLQKEADKSTRRVIDLDAIASRPLIAKETIQALATANQAATMAIASIPTGIFQQIAQVQQQLITHFEPIRQAMELLHERIQRMWEQIREALDRFIKPFAFIFSIRPIYLVQSQPVVHEKHLDRHLIVEADTYGFFIIGGERLTVLHPSSSRCGRLFAALLKRRARLVSYQELQQEVGSGDLRKTFKDLKYQLKKQGYRFEYELARTHGIALVGLSKLQ